MLFLYILIIFRLLYFIIQFGKVLKYLDRLVLVHRHLVQFHARAERIWQSTFVIINARQEMELECGWRHAQKRWSWEFEYFEGTVSWVFYRWGMRLSFSDLDRQRWIEILNITRCAAHWGGVSIVWLAWLLRIVSLSSCRHGPKPGINKPVRIRNGRVRLCLYMYCYY